MHDVLAVVLAGGKGTRLEPLTRDRAKPAVPFGGAYRIVDFTLSNCLNSGLRKILVLTQYKALSLGRHINRGWRGLFSWELGEFVDIVPPQQRVDQHWYRGTADAVYQNIYSIEKEEPREVLILAGDHVYKMNYHHMLEFHRENHADVTVAALAVPVERAANQFGVIEVDQSWRIIGFEEKPANPKPLPNDPTRCLASMGIYAFQAHFMYEQLCQNAAKPGTSHDFGKDILPSIYQTHRVVAYPFRDENQKEEAYWRDVGTLDAYFDANMELVGVDPLLNVYDQSWPIRTFRPNLPPPKTVFADRQPGGRCGQALDSIVCPGTIISGGLAERSIVGYSCRINSYATVEDSILFDNVEIGRRAKVRRAIIDKGVRIRPDMRIGFDPEEDRRRGFTISENGIVVIAKMAETEELD